MDLYYVYANCHFVCILSCMAMAERAGDSCRHMTAEQLVDLVLSSAHPRLQERCSRDQIVNLLQEKHAAYDAHGVHSLLARKYDAVEEQLEAANAAPSTFVSSLWLMVQPALSTAARSRKTSRWHRSLQHSNGQAASSSSSASLSCEPGTSRIQRFEC